MPALVVLLLAAAVLAVVLSLPASAQPYQVTVRLTDGSLQTVVVDLPAGATLEDAVGHVEGEPVTLTPLAGTSPNPTPPSTPKPPPPAAKPDPAAQPTPNKPAASGDVAKPQTPAKQQPKQTKPKQKRPHPKHRRKKQQPKPQPKPKSSHPLTGGHTAPLRRSDGTPTPTNPGFVDALPGPSTRRGVPNFVIRKFRVPPFLLPIYQAAGIQYGVRWEILAAINEIETDYGRNLNVSSAGALGWMQFMPSTWKTWGVDGNKDHKKDPYNPVDAIFAAARYLKAAGYSHDVRRSIFAYNHADWYVDSVMLRARLIAGVPADLVGSLTGLTEGHFPVYARARYADDLAEQKAQKRVKPGQNAAHVIQSSDDRHGIDIFSSRGAPAVAVNDGVIKKLGESRKLGRYVVLQDVYGNRYMYGHLGTIARYYPVPKDDAGASTGRPARALHASRDSAPTTPASAGHQTAPADTQTDSAGSEPVKERLFAHPGMPGARENGGLDQLLDAKLRKDGGVSTFKNYFSRPFGLDSKDVRLRRLKVGAHVIGGTILGRIGMTEPGKAPHLYFEIRPAGKGAPRIDPKPILDGWKLLEATAIYRANGKNALRDGGHLSIGQILLMPQAQLERTVLHDPRIEIYPCGRQDIRAGSINRRVLATLEYLANGGFKPTVSSLKCGHGFLTASGNVSEHSSGNAVDIAEVNGIPILGHQERGGITEQTVRFLMRLQGTMRPHQIISLLDLGGNSMALPDHYNHIHVGFYARFGSNRKAGMHALAVLKPGQWSDLMSRLRHIDNPVVPTTPSRYAIPVRPHHRRGD
ncbi:MAG: lytic murein transglycosylase [Thermoleophilaceae bacterium]